MSNQVSEKGGKTEGVAKHAESMPLKRNWILLPANIHGQGIDHIQLGLSPIKYFKLISWDKHILELTALNELSIHFFE